MVGSEVCIGYRSVTVFGKLLTQADWSQIMRLGRSKSDSTFWTSDTAIKSRPSVLVGVALPIVGTVAFADRVGTVSAPLPYTHLTIPANTEA